MAIQIINETPEERARRINKINKRIERNEKILSFFRFIIYFLLEIVFNILSLITKGLFCILSVPLVCFIAKFIYMIFKGNKLVMNDFIDTVLFIVLPFLIFFIHQLTENTADYFRNNKY